jgi:hypothetical protein
MQGYAAHALDVTVGEQKKKLECKIYQCDLSSDSSIKSFSEHFKDNPLDLLLKIASSCPLQNPEFPHSLPRVLTLLFSKVL